MASNTTWILALACVTILLILVIVLSTGSGPMATSATPEELSAKKAEVESSVDKALAIIHKEYVFEDDTRPSSSGKYCYWYKQGKRCFSGEWGCENICYSKSRAQYYTEVQGKMDQAILYLSAAKQYLNEYKQMNPSDSIYYNGWGYAIDAVETDAEGRRKAQGVNVVSTDENFQPTEDVIRQGAETLELRNDAIEKYEYLLSRYPEQAGEVDSVNRLQWLREKLRSNIATIDSWVITYQNQQILNAILGAYICAETGGLVCPN